MDGWNPDIKNPKWQENNGSGMRAMEKNGRSKVKHVRISLHLSRPEGLTMVGVQLPKAVNTERIWHVQPWSDSYLLYCCLHPQARTGPPYIKLLPALLCHCFLPGHIFNV